MTVSMRAAIKGATVMTLTIFAATASLVILRSVLFAELFAVKVLFFSLILKPPKKDVLSKLKSL